jgi:hypothetical protein
MTGTSDYRARYYDPNIGRFISEDPIRFEGGYNFYAYTLNNPVNWIDPSGLEIQECRRPIRFPGTGDTPHTFLYSTETGTGYGFGPANDWWFPVSFLVPVPGGIEHDYPYDSNGKLKPNYSCRKVSENQCFEDCVIRKSAETAEDPPLYELGVYQCDTWAADIERQCKEECHTSIQ